MIPAGYFLFLLFAFMMGAFTGRIANRCIQRLPWEQSIFWPHALCPNCHSPVSGTWSTLPIVGTMLGGRCCPQCGDRRSFQPTWVALILGLLFAYTAWHDFLGPALHYDLRELPVTVLGARLVYHWSLVTLFVVATGIDAEHQIIPRGLTDYGLVVGLVWATIWPEVRYVPFQSSSHWDGAVVGLSGVVAGVVVVYSVRLLGFLLFRRESMGLGDVSLMAVIGAHLGSAATVITLFLASFLGLGHALIKLITKVGRMMRGRRPRASDGEMAFGPYLCLAAILLLWTWPWFWADWVRPRMEALQFVWEMITTPNATNPPMSTIR